MAHLRPLTRKCQIATCRSQARHELFSRYNLSFGVYCRVCGLLALKSLQKDEDERAQSQKAVHNPTHP